ncbi:MAG: hypothetical protein K6E29_09205 [Cyanobacteria bacterium RUI128]|nr:hypothetical protein [Cyanobacteria bacterium RUI128]
MLRKSDVCCVTYFFCKKINSGSKIYFLIFFISMIYSVLNKHDVPVSITKETHYLSDLDTDMTRYNVFDESERHFIGYVDLRDTKNGARVLYITNQNQKLYKHFGHLADQIEVEHCMNRGIETPYIQSVAARDSYIQHYLRGKRFINEGVNIYLGSLTENLKKGERVTADFLEYQKMYMPINMVNEIKDKIKRNPLLKHL